MKVKRILSLLLVVAMVIGFLPFATKVHAETQDTTDTDMNENVILNKSYETIEKDHEYLLTLDAYVKGEADIITKVKPADIVLVLDQSASMYAPMGAKGGKNNKTLYDPVTAGDTNVTKLTEADILNFYNENPQAFLNNASHLGYFVAQSSAGGTSYCDKGLLDSSHKHFTGDNPETNTEDCRTYDWFIIEYVANDPSKPWHFYRVPQTSNPSNDSKKPIIDENGKVELSHEAYLWTRELFVCPDVTPATVKNHSGCKICVLGGSNFNFYKSQYGALYDAISVFADGIIDADVGHRLAVTSFSAEIEYQRYATGSGIYVNGQYRRFNNRQYYTSASRTEFTTWDKVYSATTLSDADYKAALMETKNNRANVMASIEAVRSDSYGTNHDVGMYIANRIFEQNPIAEGEKRDRIVILFTDGEPSPVSLKAYTNGYSKNDFGDADQNGMRDAFIDQARIAKKEHGAQIYTIWTSTLTDSRSAFMRYGSSDYPDATKANDVGTPIASPKYASGVKSGQDLMNAFGQVFEDVSSSTITELKAPSILRDIIAPSFTLPSEGIEGWNEMSEDEKLEALASKIQVYESKYLGNGNFAQPGDEGYTEFTNAEIHVYKDASGNYQVDVSNFDYAKNYVTDLDLGGFVGSKLVVKIPIVVKPDFLGGDSVITNGKESGIYNNGELVDIFPVPNVDVLVSEITPGFKDAAIYVSQQAELPHIANIGRFKIGTEEFYIDGINNAYVKLVYTISDKNDSSKSMTATIPEGTVWSENLINNLVWSGTLTPEQYLENDKQYEISCKVISVNNEDNDSEATGTPTIYVYKPHVTFKDSLLNYNDKANYDTNNKMNTVVWKNAAVEAIADETAKAAKIAEHAALLGNAPILSYTYSPADNEVTVERNVSVTGVKATNNNSNHVGNPNMELLGHTTFYRDDCDVCGHEHGLVSEDAPNFVVHLNNFDLVITKVVEGNVDENQSFLFRITGPNNFSMDVDIQGAGSVTIKGLTAGVYNVHELTDWSWRYLLVSGNDLTADASEAVEGKVSVSFTNKRDKIYWLSGECCAKNWWGASGLDELTNTAIIETTPAN